MLLENLVAKPHRRQNKMDFLYNAQTCVISKGNKKHKKQITVIPFSNCSAPEALMEIH